MQQVVNFLWICGLYMALSFVMAYTVAAYDPRRPKLKDDDNPSEKKTASRKERVRAHFRIALLHFQLISAVWHLISFDLFW